MNQVDIQSDNKSDMSPFIENITQIWKKRKFIIWNTFGFIVLSIVISLILPKWYASQASIISSGGGKSNFLSMLSGIPMGDFGLSALNEDISTYIAILESRAVRENLVNKFDLISRYDSKDVEFAMAALNQYVELKVSEEGSLIITVLDKDPIVARDMANELIIQLDEVNRRISSEKGYFNREFLEGRLIQNREELKIAENDLKLFQQTYGLIDVPSQVTSAIETYAQIYAKKVEADVQYEIAKSIYLSNDPKVLQLLKMKVELNQLLDEMVTKGDDKKVLLAFQDLPDLGLEYARLFREVELQSRIMEFLVPQYEQARMDETKDIPSIQVIDKPYIAINKTKPRRSLIVIATTIMAGLLSILFVVLEYRTKELRGKLKNV
ncbi:GumC family protein [Candidatus Neomarinimicrobiota bacterium]